MGGLATGPVTAEVTYGLERLASYIQEMDSVYDIEWADGVRYGEIFRQPEFEHSKYSFEVSDQALLLANLKEFLEKNDIKYFTSLDGENLKYAILYIPNTISSILLTIMC